MDKISFKERVKLNSIKYSKIYKEKFVDKEYLLFSNAFKNDKYYILRAHENNYLHLIGVHTTLNPIDFFNKCLNGSLSENDFDFIFKNKEEKTVKGSVRRKIISLKQLDSFFNNITGIKENFGKGNILCAIAGTDNIITIGYAKAKACIPMTLLKGNELGTNAVKCDLLLSKDKNKKPYTEIIIGNQEILDSFLLKNNEILFKK